MENFNEIFKNDLLARMGDGDGACSRARLSAAFKTSGALSLERKSFILKFESENRVFIEALSEIVKKQYRTLSEVTETRVRGGLKSDVPVYSIRIPAAQTREILIDAGLMTQSGDALVFLDGGIDPSVVETRAAAIAYISTLFIGCGSVSLPKLGAEPQSATGGAYHLEFVIGDERLANDVRRLLAELEIEAKITERKNNYVVYIKDSEILSNFFALSGSGESVMRIQEILLERALFKQLAREANFSTANMDKTAKASGRQIAAIETIEDTIGLDAIPEQLRVVARIRKENPYATMEEMLLMLPDVGKSGLNHRLRKLVALAERLENGGK
ncbi:MAG: DNA-binding protein WhiA [Clostridiaceae bacterium]|jgi:DNA-binding protein WhiA|nr:DNA-binding protein WhiA [Clostridiaceae bacterium]